MFGPGTFSPPRAVLKEAMAAAVGLRWDFDASARSRSAPCAAVEAGPIPALQGVVRWCLIDLAQWVWKEFTPLGEKIARSPPRPGLIIPETRRLTLLFTYRKSIRI